MDVSLYAAVDETKGENEVEGSHVYSSTSHQDRVADVAGL